MFRCAAVEGRLGRISDVELDSLGRLPETGQPIKRIAVRCGFGAEVTMRRTFQRVQGVGPQDYRALFPG